MSLSTNTIQADDASHGPLKAGGAMGALMRSIDWSETPLGAVESWSPALRMMVSFLANRFPVLVWWGPQHIQLYNDPYRPVLGDRHPKAMGQPGPECFRDIWDIIGPLAETPFNGGPSTWIEDLALEFNRSTFIEETHFTVAYSPVPDETAPRGIGGVVATVYEISEKIVAERRVKILRDVGTYAVEAKTAADACSVIAETLAGHGKDVPFALFYLIEKDTLRLAATSGVEASATGPDHWPIREAIERGHSITVEGLSGRFSAVPPGPWPDPPHTAIVIPIRSNLAHQHAGVLILGVSARLAFDDRYRDFCELLASQVATAIANARAYEEERKRAEALAEIDRAKTAFFSNVSHEFRTPLTLMLGPLADILAEEDTPNSKREQLELIQRNGLRLLRLVNTLLDFSRIEAGRTQGTYEPTDLSAFTAELASVFRSAIEKAGLRLVLDCRPLPEPVYVDCGMWEKIVFNLVSNAFKFTFEGEITIAVRQSRGCAQLSVRDTGTGIPERELVHLFDRFHRVEGAKGRTFEGTGIGLALVKELATLMGGTVAAASEEGRGSVFTVSVPFGKDHLPEGQIAGVKSTVRATRSLDPLLNEAFNWLRESDAEVSLPSNEKTGASLGEEKRHVLLADDNADMREYARRLLGSQYRVTAVADGQQALEAAVAQRPDLVLTDVMMPRLDGFGLLAALRANSETADIPVIMLSARAGEEAKVEGLAATADDYLVKPFSARELLARVSGTLAISKIRRDSLQALRASEAEREKTLALIAGQNRVLEMLASGAKLADVLSALIHMVEEQSPGLLGSILVRPPEGLRFHMGIGPSLPEGYMEAVSEGPVKPPYVGPCGMAADLGKAVATCDIAGDERWSEEWRKYASGLGLRASYSAPILASDGRTLGSFGIYYREVQHDPKPVDLRLLETATHLAGVAIEHRQTEDAMRTRTAQFETLLNDAPVGVYLVDDEFRIREVNPTALPVFGDIPDLIGRDFEEVMHILWPKKYADEVIARFRHTLETGEPYVVAERIEERRDRGVREYYEWQINRIQLLEGRCGVVCYFRDISAQVLARQQIEDGAHRLRFMAESMPQKIFTAKPNGDRDYFNKQWLDFTGLPLDQLKDWGWTQCVHPNDVEENMRVWTLSIETGEPFQYVQRFRRADGAYRWHLSRARAMRDSAGKVTMWIGSNTEIHEQKQIEEQLRRLNDDLNQFAFAASHDLQEPLRMVTSYSQMLVQSCGDQLGEVPAVCVGFIQEGTRRMRELLADLLAYTQVASFEEESTEQVDLNVAFENATDNLKTAIEESGAEVTNGGLPVVMGRTAHFVQLFQNLISNAIKYRGEAAPRIRVWAERRKSEWQVGVKDNGMGINEQYHQMIFGVFKRLHGKAISGTGIGLAICQRVVERYGGRIWVESKPGEGATFCFTLPVAECETR